MRMICDSSLEIDNESGVMNPTAETVLKATGGELIRGEPETEISGISIDSRTVGSGEVFFAIKGEKQDGHSFIEEAMEGGASGAVVSEKTDVDSGAGGFVVKVEDTTGALGKLGSLIRKKWGGELIGITGSTGKTTTKELLGEMLNSRHCALVSRGNYNTKYGLPLTLGELKKNHRIAVCEMGISKKGEMKTLAEIALPDEMIFTNISPVHMMNFRNIKAVAKAKSEVLDVMTGGKVHINGDDPLLKDMVKNYPGDVTTYGFTEGVDLKGEILKDKGVFGSRICVRKGDEDKTFDIKLPGKYSVYNVLAALSAALNGRADFNTCSEILEDFSPQTGRGKVYRFENEITVVDDSYNSNPFSMKNVLKTLTRTSVPGRKMVAAGDMLELGNSAKNYHKKVGSFAAKSGIDLLAGVGEQAKYTVEAFGGKSKHFKDSGSAGEFLVENIKEGDLLLVKGSRSIHMEKIVDMFKSEYREKN